MPSRPRAAGVPVRPATLTDAPAIIATLTRAFATDPFIVWLVARAADPAVGMQRFFASAFHDLTFPYGEVLTTTAHEGAALWAPPGTWSPNILAHVRLLPAFVRMVGFGSFVSRLRGVDAVERMHPTYAHWYLLTLGVDPAFQGRGIGRALVDPVLARCDADGLPAYLETSTERNVKMYEGWGFAVTATTKIAADGPTMWGMERAPRGGSAGDAT